jgi:hypothetical protein
MRFLLGLLVLLCCWLTVPTPGLAAPVVLFDQGHGQPFRVDGDGPYDLSALGACFAAAGYEIRVATGPLADEELAGVTALVISGAFQPLSEDELATLRRFLANGGGVAVMLHIAPPVAGLLGALQVEYANGILHESHHTIAGNPQQFRVRALAEHPLTAGLEEFALYGGWALRGAAAEVESLAWTSPQAWVDLDRNRQAGPADAIGSFGVMVAGAIGHGRFVVFGDDALFQNRFLDASNRRLAANLAGWLLADRAAGGLEPKLQ